MSNIILPEKAKVGVQERESFGDKNSRVWEAPVGEKTRIGVNLGDITYSPTQAILCPTTPWFQIGGGGVENAIDAAFGGNIDTIGQRIVQIVHGKSGNDDLLEDIRKFKSLTGLNHLDVKGAIKLFKKLKSRTSNEDSISFTECVPINSSGEMQQRGIKNIILASSTPEGKRYSVDDIASITRNAMLTTVLAGRNSVTIPAIGTGFAAAFGFGISMKDAIKGFVKGVIDAYLNGIEVQNVDFNIYAQPSPKNAQDVHKLMTDIISQLET